MIVVGGVYSEYCYQPDWNQIFGSGGRGAAALTRLGVEDVKLFTCLPEKSKKSAQATLAPYGVEIEVRPSAALYEFAYLHPLSEPTLAPNPEVADAAEPISGDAVLAYGMLEGLPAISARRAIFDPQSETRCKSPRDFIHAKEIALVLNQRELELIFGSEAPEKIAEANVHEGTVCCVVVKRGPFGCTVIDKNGVHSIPVFPTKSVFKIGSGDIFSASFAKFWGIDNMNAPQAAENASKCTSLYCDTRSIDSLSLLSEFSGQSLSVCPKTC